MPLKDSGDDSQSQTIATGGPAAIPVKTNNINERFFIGLEGRYRWIEDIYIRESVASVPVEYSGDLGGFRF